MSTYMAKAENIDRKWYIVDAADKPLGRTAATVAALLRGKHKVEFTPHVDTGDFVIVLNSDKVVLTGKKLEQKFYTYHTGYIGGLKQVPYRPAKQVCREPFRKRRRRTIFFQRSPW